MGALVLTNDELPQKAREILKDFDVRRLPADPDALASAEVLVAWPVRVKPDDIKSMTRLRMIQTLSAGVDALPLEAIPAQVQLYSNAGAFTLPVAEHAWGLLMGIAKGIHVRGLRTVPRSLRGKTLLVLGAGEIGTEVARLARSLQMKVIGVSRSFKHPEAYDERFPSSELKAAVREADAVVIALPLTRETRGLVDYDTLNRCREAVMVVNVGRGETVDEEGLLRWLKERPESRFATDVFWKREGKEVFDTKGWEMSNFAGTLHISGLPLGVGLETAYVQAARNVADFLTGRKTKNQVDLREYRMPSR